MADQTPSIVAYFVRHGSTELNDQNKFRGPLDPPLDDHGLDDAHEVGQFFTGVKLGDAWSSDRQRAETTASAVLEPKGMTYTPDATLRAFNVGYLAGEPKSERQDDIKYFDRHPDEQIPQGESINQFRNRVRPAILRSIQSGVSKGAPSITFAHSSVLKEVSNVVTGDHNTENVHPGGVLGVTYDGSKYGVKALLKPKAAGAKDGYGQ